MSNDAANNILALASRPDGEIAVRDTTVGAGGNFGLLYEPRPGTRVGLTYYSPVRLNFGAVPAVTGLSNPIFQAMQNRGAFPKDIALGMRVPQSVMVGTYHEVTDRWAMMLDFGWQQWSQFGKVELGSPATM